MSKYRITIEGKTYEMEIELMHDSKDLSKSILSKENRTSEKVGPVDGVNSPVPKTTVIHSGAVVVPMPGTVIRIDKSEGNTVKAGDVVLILEAMKMENEIHAPVDGTIVKMNCAVGSTVAAGEVLFEVQ